MGATQREFRALAVVEADLRPFPGSVAIAAGRAEATRVDVFAGVTSRAVLRQLALSGGLAMAGDAGRFRVRADQRESALTLVVELVLPPDPSRMTVRALAPESTVMGVVDRMARDAVPRRVLVAAARVTAAAGRRLVGARERVVGLVVIETRRLPRQLVVTLPAVFGQGSVMSVVVAVAADAVEWCIAPRDVGDVARSAARALVGAEQGVVRLCVIEGGFGEPPDVCIASAMIPVTRAALARRREGMFRVEAFPCREIGRDLFVAVEAERALRVRLERLMAGRALRFVLRMRFDERPRHHHLLPIDRPGE